MKSKLVEVDKAKFEQFCAHNYRKYDIACLLGVTCGQLRKWCKRTYNDTLENAIQHFTAPTRAKMQDALTQAMFGEKINERLAILYAKNYLGWCDSPTKIVNVVETDEEITDTTNSQDNMNLLNALGARVVTGAESEDDEDAEVE